MSGLNIRQFAKVEPTNGEDTTGNQPDRNQRHQEANENDSEDSDAEIQYFAPDQTPCGKCSIAPLRSRDDGRGSQFYFRCSLFLMIQILVAAIGNRSHYISLQIQGP